MKPGLKMIAMCGVSALVTTVLALGWFLALPNVVGGVIGGLTLVCGVMLGLAVVWRATGTGETL